MSSTIRRGLKLNKRRRPLQRNLHLIVEPEQRVVRNRDSTSARRTIAREQMFPGTKQQNENRSGSKSTIVASFAALGSVVLASSCCLPLFPFLFAAGTAGSSAFFVKLRPFLAAASVLLVVYGFYQGWRMKKCNCKPSPLSIIVLWFSAVVVAVFTLFPQAMANFVANALAR